MAFVKLCLQSFVCSMFCALIRRVKKTTDTLECWNVVLLHINHRHVSPTHMAIFRVDRTKTQTRLQRVGINPHIENLCNFS
jgi:hypothetical protein